MFDAQGKAVLVDFGLAARILVDPTALTAFCGTPEFMAPEVLDRQAYSTAVDWWSLGVVAFTMLLGFVLLLLVAILSGVEHAETPRSLGKTQRRCWHQFDQHRRCQPSPLIQTFMPLCRHC
eukprot:c18733_g1_i1.p1 GENE.c18733_g1_i1~~c18733_g1_i1.p1  ORF type:complete len:121 (+),score=14.76 c18733_g1_i1:609-971(+)